MLLDLRWSPARALGFVVAVGALAACTDDDPTGVQRPATPANVQATATGRTTVRVTYAAVSGATGYVVQRATGAAGGTFASVGSPATTTFDDAGLTTGTTYRYQVAALRGADTSGFSAPVAVTTAGLGAAPANVAVTATGATSVRVAFDAVAGAAGYVVQRAEGPAGAFATVASPAAPPYVDGGLQPATIYRYQVAVIRPGNDTSAYSAPLQVTTGQPGVATAVLTGDITADRTLFPDTVYVLRGFVKVRPPNGQAGPVTLTVLPGTRIVGDTTVAGSTLFVYQGARLNAAGTRQNPIVFTSQRAAGNRKAGDWGGIILIGRARTNRGGAPVSTEGPTETQVVYNQGTDDADDSGTLRYVRIEFAGFAASQDNELNSLSMYAVGSGTTLEYVQVVNGLDDSFEWWGGTVNGRYLVSYEAGDDHFDWTEGYRGRNQFLIALQTYRPPTAAGSAGGASNDPQIFEGDGCQGTGCPAGNASTPFSSPVFANFTVVGPGPNVLPTGGGFGLVVRRGTGGTFLNGVVARMPNRAITIPDTATNNRFTADSLTFRNLLLADNAANFDPAGSTTAFAQAARFATFAVDTLATGVGAGTLFTALPAPGAIPSVETLDWTPAAGAPALLRTGGLATFTGAVAARAGTFVTGTAYRGAADPAGTSKWWEGWTTYPATDPRQ